jgi:hypothetical protein
MFIWPFNYYSAMSPLPDLFGGVWVVGRTVITCETPGPVYEMLNNLFVKTSVRDLGGISGKCNKKHEYSADILHWVKVIADYIYIYIYV